MLYELRGASKTYRKGRQDLTVLDRIDLDIPERSFIALMGPSGSGKSTLLNLLGALDQPSVGEVKFRGVALTGLSEGERAKWRAQNIGFVFQFYNLLPGLSARNNVELPLLLTSATLVQRRERVDTALELVGLLDRGMHRPAELSGGEQQRVAIARALIANPAVLLADEPTGDLDHDSAQRILSLLQLLHRELGKTVLMVTHDPDAAKYADRTWFLRKGVLERQANVA